MIKNICRFVRIFPSKRPPTPSTITTTPSTPSTTSTTMINPSILIPRDGPPTPRYNERILTQISNHLHGHGGNGYNVSRKNEKDIREFAITPSSKRLNSTKGKLKGSIRKLVTEFMSNQEDSITYLKPLKPRRPTHNHDEMHGYGDTSDITISYTSDTSDTSSGVERKRNLRAVRMAENLQIMIAEIIHRYLRSHPIINTSTISITNVVVSCDLKVCTIKWVPLIKTTPENVEKYEVAMDKLKGVIRWHLSSRLSHLQSSPSLIFLRDYT